MAQETSKYSLTTPVKLNDGIQIPLVGLGTFELARTQKHTAVLRGEDKRTEEEKTAHEEENTKFVNAVCHAIEKCGYRHIDTASAYDTERLVGEALARVYKNTKLTRKDIFVTTKYPSRHVNPSQLGDIVEQSVKYIGDYIDLYLIHSPHTKRDEKPDAGADICQVYKKLLEYRDKGLIKSVGVSNFGVKHLQIMESLGLPLPSCNQIEIHPFMVEKELIEYCQKKGIVLEAYSPLARADEVARTSEDLKTMGERYKKTWAQVMLRWGLQKGFVILPKSVTPSRIEANANIFDFELSTEDIAKLDKLAEINKRTCWNPMILKWGNLEDIKKSML